MRLLFVSPSYYPHIGGVEYVVKSVVERLIRLGHDVTVLAGEPSADRPYEEEVNGVHVIRWPIWSPGKAYHFPRKRSNLENLLREIAKKVDAMHFHSVHSILTVYSLDSLKDIDVRKVLTPYYHGTGHTLLRKLLWIPWRQFIRRVMRYTTIVHTVSKLEAQLIEKDFSVKAIPIENGVKESILGIPWKPENYVMYSGRVERYKNIHRLANIVEILNKEYGYDLELRIFGKGPFRKALEKQLHRLGVRFVLSDFHPFEKYIEYLSHASLFGLLSEKESYPQSVNEANAIGVPVVVVEPWGRNFSGRSRTLIVSLRNSDAEIAKKIAEFLDQASKQPISVVPSWSDAVKLYINMLYEG